ncbi:MAG: hypothetical protein A2X94_17005 [Bdellovibrionales bacterium GWB1_55_8]|nr:MAG: hypothetical protein A2X94_17005 [Bdellovibrionales bacterium GWB1_55_8]
MELSYDWTAFQGVFRSKRRAFSSRSESGAPIFVIIEQGSVVAAFAEGEDLSEWLGAELAEMNAEFGNRPVISFDRSEVDGWISESAALPHFIEQSDLLLEKAASRIRKDAAGTKGLSAERLLAQEHFLVEALKGWWKKVLPSNYGIYLRLEGEKPEDLLMVFRRGRLELFQRGDLAGMSANDQTRTPQEIVKYLSERTMVPVQGIFIGARDWADWGQSPAPWRKVSRAMGGDRLKLVPFRWDLAALIAARGWVGL